MPEIDKLVTVKLDKERHMRLTLKGMIGFEKLTGKSLTGGIKLNDLSLEDKSAMFWACLIHEDKELTYSDVLDMIDIGNIGAIMDAFVECISQALPEAEASNRPLAKKPPHG